MTTVTITNDMTYPEAVFTVESNKLLRGDIRVNTTSLQIVFGEETKPIDNGDGTYTYIFNNPISFDFEMEERMVNDER